MAKKSKIAADLRRRQVVVDGGFELQRIALAEDIGDQPAGGVVHRRVGELRVAAVEGVGGRLVKFVGDGALAVFEPPLVDAAVEMLLELKDDVDRFFSERSWECRAAVKVHFGSVVAGQFGSGAAERFDVLGKQVNTAATLTGPGVAIPSET